MAEGDRVGLVLAGGWARGADEAGAMSVVLPKLERPAPDGHRRHQRRGGTDRG